MTVCPSELRRELIVSCKLRPELGAHGQRVRGALPPGLGVAAAAGAVSRPEWGRGAVAADSAGWVATAGGCVVASGGCGGWSRWRYPPEGPPAPVRSSAPYPRRSRRARRLPWRPAHEPSSGLAQVDGSCSVGRGRRTRLRGELASARPPGPAEFGSGRYRRLLAAGSGSGSGASGIGGRELQVAREAVADRDFAVSLAGCSRSSRHPRRAPTRGRSSSAPSFQMASHLREVLEEFSARPLARIARRPQHGGRVYRCEHGIGPGRRDRPPALLP